MAATDAPKKVGQVEEQLQELESNIDVLGSAIVEIEGCFKTVLYESPTDEPSNKCVEQPSLVTLAERLRILNRRVCGFVKDLHKMSTECQL